MAAIINFEKQEKSNTNNKDMHTITMPTEKEIDLVNKLVDYFSDDEMLDIKFWNGASWQSMFEDLFKPYAEENNLNVWDVFAVFIMKTNGLVFIENEDGSTRIRY